MISVSCAKAAPDPNDMVEKVATAAAITTLVFSCLIDTPLPDYSGARMGVMAQYGINYKLCAVSTFKSFSSRRLRDGEAYSDFPARTYRFQVATPTQMAPIRARTQAITVNSFVGRGSLTALRKAAAEAAQENRPSPPMIR